MTNIVSTFNGGPVETTHRTLYTKSVSRTPDARYFFLNNQYDTDGGTVAHADAYRMPVRTPDDKVPHFSDIELPYFAPEIDDPIVCLRQPTYGDRSRAHFWAPSWLWYLACQNFIVLKHTPDGRSIMCDKFAGVWDLSVRYATSLWDGGVICTVGGTTYTIMEVIRDLHDKEFYVTVTDDPRLERNELPMQYRDLGILPA
ncbi:MAG: hypothetical protein ACQR33_04870 [Candidatus Saccharibacteria bacterium]